MQVVEKKIINRNNMKYLYVERTEGNFNHVQYNVYHSIKNCQKLSMDDYVSTFGEDKKIPVIDFIKEVQDDIIFEDINPNIIKRLLTELKKIETRIKIFNKFNPSLWGYKATLLSCIDTFNKVLEENPRIIEEYDYEKDLNRLNGTDIEDALIELNNPNKPLVRVRKIDNLTYVHDNENKEAV